MMALDHMPGPLALIHTEKLRQTSLLDHLISMHHAQLFSFEGVMETRICVGQFVVCPMVTMNTSEKIG